jgi:hypothetical protein
MKILKTYMAGGGGDEKPIEYAAGAAPDPFIRVVTGGCGRDERTGAAHGARHEAPAGKGRAVA